MRYYEYPVELDAMRAFYNEIGYPEGTIDYSCNTDGRPIIDYRTNLLGSLVEFKVVTKSNSDVFNQMKRYIRAYNARGLSLPKYGVYIITESQKYTVFNLEYETYCEDAVICSNLDLVVDLERRTSNADSWINNTKTQKGWIDENSIVAYNDIYFSSRGKSRKKKDDFIAELANPTILNIKPYEWQPDGDMERKLLDCLGSAELKKRLGAFFTPEYAARQSTNYVRNIIRNLSEDEDYVIVDRCYDEETEFLSKDGWKKMKDYKEGDFVMQYNLDKTATFVKPQKVINQEYTDDWVCYKSSQIDFKITKNHDCVVYDNNNKEHKIFKITAEDLYKRYKKNNNTHYCIPKNFIYNGDLDIDEWKLRIFCAINADGTYRPKQTNKGNAQRTKRNTRFTCQDTSKRDVYRLRFKKQRKIDRMMYLLNQANLEYKMSYEARGYTCFTFNFDLVKDCKHFPKEWYNLSKHSKEIILDEIFYWDGSIREGKFGISKSYSTSKKEDADFIMFVINSLGYSSNVREDKRRDKINYEIRYNSISSALIAKHPKDKGMFLSPAKEGDRCYCFTVDSGMLIVRRNNKIFISSNCSGGGALEQFFTEEELSHCILSTMVFAEKTTLKGLYEGKVKAILPLDETTDSEGCMPSGDALSEEFNDGLSTVLEICRRDAESRGKKLVVIGLENPPYKTAGSDAIRGKGREVKSSSDNFITEKMKESGKLKNRALVDFANKFIWSGFEYFFDYYVVYAPIKYWKNQNVVDKKFLEGSIANRADFHATDGGISIISWKNEDAVNEHIILQARVGNEIKDVIINKLHQTPDTLFTYKKQDDGEDIWYELTSGTPDFKHGYIGNQRNIAHQKSGIGGFINVDDPNFKNILPLFVANCYTCKDFTEKEIIMKSGDKGSLYQEDREFLEDCFLWCCLTDRNKCISDGTRQNEMALEQNSKADQIVDRIPDHRMKLIGEWRNVITQAKACEEYNPNYKYGLAQIISDLDINIDTSMTDKNGKFLQKKKNQGLDDAIISLKTELKKFYSDYLEPKLFEYELLK